MTNAEKYLKVSVNEFFSAIIKSKIDISGLYSLEKWLLDEAKPTLTEDERVILRNLRYEKGAYEYTKIGRTDLDSEGRCDLILIDSDNESVWWGEYGHLFQFIKERGRI